MIQTSIQALIGMSTYILSELGKIAKSYSDVPKLLGEVGILEESDTQLFRKICT